jgi:thioredoxin reductase/ferredoxin
MEQGVPTVKSGKTVAVVGAGPAGLACAHDLTVLGHRVIVFDARPDPGGLMTGGIPWFRFPVASARAECVALLALGVEFHGRSQVSDLATLRAMGVDAIFLALGASRAATRMLETAPQHPDILDAMEVLSNEVVPIGQTVVAGEGPLAVDVARVLAKRLLNVGAASVQLVMTTPLGGSGLPSELIASSARDGIPMHYGWRVTAVNVDAESGLLSSINVAEADGTAARVIPCDRLVLAAARAPDLRGIGTGLELTRSGFIATDPQTLRTSLPNVWAGGACAFGHRSIAHAVADGKRAAWEIHAAMTGTRITTTFASAWVEANGHTKPDRPEADRRRTLPLMDSPSSDPFAAPTPRAATRAGEEAARCFDCAQIPALTGTCTTCHRCAESCPTGAISIVEKAPTIAGELCNRCGDCIGACPDGALTMLRAEWEERLTFA